MKSSSYAEGLDPDSKNYVHIAAAITRPTIKCSMILSLECIVNSQEPATQARLFLILQVFHYSDPVIAEMIQ